ncbi:MAG TPA: 1,6-anhydro-N-acetylmuramyl-L-alanine amidase AmpD [Gammaproteobacteria bacterium]|nr:1,6-anhydro-N-acetylmuramyl-L-alanine amidase AmpD [Gammaproteobacteria bacterium]
MSNARYTFSPNQDERPKHCVLDTLVIHCISLPPGEFGGSSIEDLFMNRLTIQAHPFYAMLKGLKVSAHLLIQRNGEIIQFVPFHKRAWHAGVSEFLGRTQCNDFSIGIELEGTDSSPFEIAQYESLIACTLAICKSYNKITKDRIVGHSEVAPGRKTDPGPFFNWDFFKNHLNL